MTKIIAVTNQKGGVGKTTSSVNLAAALAKLGRQVLLVDMDPQGNATMGCGIEKKTLELSTYDVLLEECELVEAIVKSAYEGLDLLPTNIDLTAVDVLLMEKEQREHRLKLALASVKGQYDYVLIDCPPSLSMLTVNALAAANSVLVPMQCEYFALEGLSALMDTLKQIRKTVNSGLKLEGLLRTMFDGRSRLTRDVSEQLLEHFADRLFETVIPRNVRLAEAPSFGMPIVHYDKSSKGAFAYMQLAKELDQKYN